MFCIFLIFFSIFYWNLSLCPLSNDVTPHHIYNLYVLLKLLETHFTRDTNHVSFFLLSSFSPLLFSLLSTVSEIGRAHV